MSETRRSGLRIKRYLLSGLLTVIPLWITWVLFRFVFDQLSNFGMPWARALSKNIHEDSPNLARWLLEPWLQDVMAALLVLLALYLLGWMVNRVIGRKLVAAFEGLVTRLPLVQGVYKAVKQFLSVIQQKPGDVQRVVLIEFPHSEMKAVGLVTRTLEDEKTGEKLAAVYVPTTPNPTSGYVEIVPISRLVSTDWTLDEAMNFLVSGGAVGPQVVRYRGGDT